MNTSQITRERFLANLRQSGLVDEPELRSAVLRLPETNRGKLVARAFVEWGLLTKFQAELLLAGLTRRRTGRRPVGGIVFTEDHGMLQNPQISL